MEANLANENSLDHNKIVFTQDDSSPLSLAYPNEKLNIVIKKHKTHRITIHGLRHTCFPIICNLKLELILKKAQKQLGRTVKQTTMNIYIHARNRHP